MVIHTDRLTILQGLFCNFEAALDKTSAPNHGVLDTHRKNEARKVLKAECRVFVMGYITYNPDVTDDDRREMGTPIHSKTRNPAPIPADRPIIGTSAVDNRKIAVVLRDLATGKRGKPQNVHGAEIVFEIRDDPPAVGEDLRNSTVVTVTKKVYVFAEYERSKHVYFAARWENGSTKEGPWSDIVSAIIP
jgi:hypothetical protein